MGIYDRQKAEAKASITAKGESVVWRVPVAVVPSTGPATPWKPSAGIPTDYPVHILFGDEETTVDKDSGEAKISIKNCLLHAVDFDPSLKDFVIRDGKTLNVKRLKPLAPNGDKILYYVDFEA